MNEIELNAILYYADYMSLRDEDQPVTDNCKYYYIHGIPINSAFLIDAEPFYDPNNKYFVKAYNEYNMIKNKFGEEGVDSFIEDLCAIRACGTVDAKRMLAYINQYNTKIERKRSYSRYYRWYNNQVYTYLAINEDGEYEEVQCSRDVAYLERRRTGRGFYKGSRIDKKTPKNKNN